MKKLFVICLLLVLVLSGCASPATGSGADYETIVPEAGDFTFELPEGYSVEDITDFSCTILRDEDAAAVGGIEVTPLTQKALTEDKAKSILLYLQNDFHQTNDVEYITSHWTEGDPMVTVHLRKHSEDGSESMYSHIFFEQDSFVYHLWLDEDVAGEYVADEFIAAVS